MKIPARVAALILAGSCLRAQLPHALPGVPMTPPPVAHPALAQQPLMPLGGDEQSAAMPAPEATATPTPPGKKPVDPATQRACEFRNVRVAGDELEAAVRRVAGLDWRRDLLAARATAAATGKAVLWVQALGDLEGFA